ALDGVGRPSSRSRPAVGGITVGLAFRMQMHAWAMVETDHGPKQLALLDTSHDGLVDSCGRTVVVAYPPFFSGDPRQRLDPCRATCELCGISLAFLVVALLRAW